MVNGRDGIFNATCRDLFRRIIETYRSQSNISYSDHFDGELNTSAIDPAMTRCGCNREIVNEGVIEITESPSASFDDSQLMIIVESKIVRQPPDRLAVDPKI